MWLSKTRDGRPKRNVIPGIVILLTGYAMSAHPQELHLSTAVHSFFGYTLMSAGLTRIIEISFVLKDRGSLSIDGNDPNSFQYVPVFVSSSFRCYVYRAGRFKSFFLANFCVLLENQQLLYASGFLFMGATEEQMSLLAGANVTHVSYILILYSIAFLLFLCESSSSVPAPREKAIPAALNHTVMILSFGLKTFECQEQEEVAVFFLFEKQKKKTSYWVTSKP